MPTIAELVRAHAEEEHPAVLFEDGSWSYREYAAACAARAALLAELRRPGPLHVGVLLDNVPEFPMWLGAAAVSGTVVVGINPTRRGAELARDITHTDCQVIVTDGAGRETVASLDLGPELGDDRILVVGSDAYTDLLAAVRGAPLPEPGPSPEDMLLLIF